MMDRATQIDLVTRAFPKTPDAEAFLDRGWTVGTGSTGADGEPGWVYINNGCEIHFARLPGTTQPYSRRLVLPTMQRLLEQHDFLTTRVPLGHAFGDKLVKHLGFVPTWDDHEYHYYILTELRLARKKGNSHV